MEKKIENLGRRLGNISDLPQELKKQLQSTTTVEFESKISNIIKDLEGIATIDEILVCYYRKYSEILKRQFLAGKLYRMIKDGIIVSVEGKKGVYKLIN